MSLCRMFGAFLGTFKNPKNLIRMCGSLKVITGPKGLPRLGNVLTLEPDKLHHQCTAWSQKYGPLYEFYVFDQRYLVVMSSTLLRDGFTVFDTSENTLADCLNDRPATFFGCNIFEDKELAFSTACGDNKRLSSLFRVLLNETQELTERMNKLLLESLHRTTQILLDSDVNIDITKALKEFLREYIARMLIGDTIPEEDDEIDILWEFIDSLYCMIDPSIDGPLKRFPFLRNFPGKYGNAYRRTISARDRVAKRYFDDIKATYRHGKIRGLVDVCLKSQKEEADKTGSTWLTDEYIKGLIYDTLAAGMTELLKTLRLFILLMCHHPHIQTKLQTEIDSVIGSEKFPAAENRKWMPYTDATILEILRYGSQTPLAIPHKCNKDVVLDGYLIEKDSVILPNLWGVHHDPEIWGDPWEFRPERFLDGEGSLLPSDHKLMQNVIPFGVGKRACPGQDFAKSRIFICITTLLQRMRFVPPEGEPLPSADPRSYGKQYPVSEPVYSCVVMPREDAII